MRSAKERGMLAVALPCFRLERCGWPDDVPVVLVDAIRGRDEVVAATGAARAGRIREGITLAAARALLPELRVERVDPVGELEDLEGLARALERFTPVVQIHAPGRAGSEPCALLLEVESAVLSQVRAHLATLGHACRLVHAPEAAAARVLAAHADDDAVVTQQDLRGALAPLPLGCLGLEEALEEALGAAGIHTLGQLAAIPAASIGRRFGKEGARAHRLACGLEARSAPRPPRKAPSQVALSFTRALGEPVTELAPVMALVAVLLGEVAATLARAQEAAVRLLLELRLEEGAHRMSVRLGRPMRSAERMLRVLRLRLEGVQIASPITAVTLEVSERMAWRPSQPSLFHAVEEGETVEELCARLQDTLGAERVGLVTEVDTWLPTRTLTERGAEAPAATTPPWRDPAHAHAPPWRARPRPAWTLAEAVAVDVDTLEGAPGRVRFGRTWRVVRAADGPERLSGGRSPDEGAAWQRDYWSVLLDDGRAAWIYTVEGARWFLHGWWDDQLPEGMRRVGVRPAPRSAATPAYVELVARSCFSFREGASTPEQLVTRAAELGLSGIALTDRDGLHGAVRFHGALREAGAAARLQGIHGALLTLRHGELRVDEGGASRSVAALVTNLSGWSRLCRLLTEACAHSEKGRGELPWERLLEANEGILLLARGDWAADELARLSEAAPGRTWRALARQWVPGEEAWIAQEIARARSLGIPCVATGDVLYHEACQAPLQDVLASIRVGEVLPRMGRRLCPHDDRALVSPQEMARRFREWPWLLDESLVIAERCSFGLEQLRYAYPREVVPEGYAPMGWLRELCRRGARQRYPGGPPPQVERQVAHELGVIERLGFASYFLTVHDLVRFARDRGILFQGRGSAANSVVCFLLGVTSVDPAQQALLFERFISEERGEPPDIDIDFEHERREEVLQYVYATYGRDRAAMVNEVIRWRGRMAVRDVGKAVGLGQDQVERLAAQMEHWGRTPPSDAKVREAGLDPSDAQVHHAQAMVSAIQGLPRHTSIHVGGFVISDGPLVDLSPIEPARMEGRTVLPWDKDDIDTLGFVKVDLLSLGMLTAIRRALDHVRLTHGRELDLATVPREDPAVYDLLCEADSTGVFQVESRAQQGMLPRLRPRTFYDLVIETAIVRPGPIQGGMVHPYLRRRSGEEAVTYVDPRLEPILARTLGVPIFQEQVMAMAVSVAGFTPGEADHLRRAMGAWRRKGELGPIGQKLMSGLRSQGIPEAYAQQVFAQIQGFAEYGFPESHAASFAHLVYVSAWLRCHYPAAFCAALLDSQPMGFYAPRSLVADAQRHGVEVRPVDVRCSLWDCSLEPGSDGSVLRLGLRQVRSLREEHATRLLQARDRAPFSDLGDLAARSRLPRGVLLLLARAGALDGLVEAPPQDAARHALWEIEALGEGMFEGMGAGEAEGLPAMNASERLVDAYATTGIAIHAHPVGLVREMLAREGVVPLLRLGALPDQTELEIAGLVAHRQRPQTASGVVFLGLEDETGTANVVVWPRLYERQRSVIRGEQLVRVRGVVQRQGAAVSVLAHAFAPLRGEVGASSHARAQGAPSPRAATLTPTLLPELRAPSRDFR